MRGAAAGRRGVHAPREKGDGLPAVGPHGARGLSSGRPRASQRTLPGYRRAPCLGCPRGPAWVITGHHSRGVQGTSPGGGSARAPAGRGAVLRPLHMGTARRYRERWRVPGSRARPCWAETLAGGGAAGCLESDVSDGTACPRVWAGKWGRVGSRQRWRAPVLASVRPADASVLRGARGPSRRATAEPAKSQLAAAALQGHRLTPVGPASAALPKSVLPDQATWTSEDAVRAGGLGTSELSSVSSPSVSRTGRFGGNTFIFLSLFKN